MLWLRVLTRDMSVASKCETSNITIINTKTYAAFRILILLEAVGVDEVVKIG